MSKNSLVNEITDDLMDYLYDNKIDMTVECPDDEDIKNDCVENNPGEDLQIDPVRETCLNCWRDYLENM